MVDTTGEERPEPEEEYGGPVKPFLEHLEDLRWVLVKCLAALFLGMILCMAFAPVLLEVLAWPMKAGGLDDQVNLQPLDVMGPVWIMLKCSVWGGLIVAFPFISFFAGEFVVPALKKAEKKYLFIGLGVGVGLFTVGILFGYFLMLKVSLKAFLAFAKWLNFDVTFWRAETYYSFAIRLLLGIGFSFELPVVVLTLVRLGVVNHQTLVKGRPYMVIFNLVIAAFVTPQDIFTTILMAAPMQVLFEACIWISAYWNYREKKRLEELGLEPLSD